MAKIKICGLKWLEDIKYANELVPDFVGFILSDGFKRSIKPQQAVQLKAKLSDNIKAVGVFVDEPAEAIDCFLRQGVIDIVQLHGSETPEFCSKINAPVIKMLKPTDFDKISQYEPYVDYFLFDSGTGTGKTFDWSKIPKTQKPFFLAGGLNKENISLAIKTVNPYAVDLSSCVETDGCKDYIKIKEVMECVR